MKPGKEKPSPKVGIETFGPEEAKQALLQGNNYNRPRSDKHVQRLATKMTNDNWLFNGAPLVFNGEQLLDGQHRLCALIVSGKSYDFTVVRGVDPLAFRTFDTPKRRDFATALGIDGEKYPKELASAVSWMFVNSIGTPSAEIEEKYEQLANHPTIREFVTELAEAKNHIPKGVSVGFLAAMKYLTTKLDAKLSEKFFDQFVTGEDVTDNVALLRESVGEIMELVGVDKRYVINSAFRQIWNAERAGKKLERIKMSVTLQDLR